MAILSDHGLEVIRKSGELVGSGPETKLRVSNGGMLQGVTYDYVARTEPAADTDTYTYKTGGASGTTVAVVTVVYESSSKDEILTVTRTT